MKPSAKIISIVKSPSDTTVSIMYAVGNDHYETCVEPDMVCAALLELSCLYAVEPFRMGDLGVTDEGIRNHLRLALTHFPGVGVTYEDDTQTFTARVKDGDTGRHVEGEGDGPFVAISNLLTNLGYKPKPVILFMTITVNEWLEKFQYGFKRESDEILRLEMEALLNPDAGGW